MSLTKPLNPNNAIDEIGFIIFFEKELDDPTLFSLFELEATFSDSLPQYNVVKIVKMHVDHEKPQMPTAKPGGILCSKPSESREGRLEWSVRVEANKIVVACSEFDTWETVWPTAKRYLFSAVKKFNLLENPVREVVFNCVDKFIFEGDLDSYKITDVFDSQSRYLTRNVTERNASSWHIHQGWFLFPSNGDVQALHNLNISVFTPDGKPLETVINHQIKVRKSDHKSIDDINLLLDAEDGKSGYLDVSMNECHDSNKDVLLGLLSTDMLKAINLKAAE